jgi:hypothetical protein
VNKMPRNALDLPQVASPPPAPTPSIPLEVVPLERLQTHKRNYRQHPPDQIAHIIHSIETHGVYRNVVVANDDTILAGHGVVKALRQMGRTTVSVYRLPLPPDHPQALKLLAGDNEIGHLAEVDDRLFTELLKEVHELDPDGLLGTGYDEMMLTNLVFVTRTEQEIADHNQAAAWADAGMPDYENGFIPWKIIVSFRTEADRVKFAEQVGLYFSRKEAKMWACWWPAREREDLSSVRYEKASEPAHTAPAPA